MSDWPERRRDIRLAKNIIEQDSLLLSAEQQQGDIFGLSKSKFQTEDPEELRNMFSWIPKLIEAFRENYQEDMWFRFMLRSIDEGITPLFKNEEQRIANIQIIFKSLRLHLQDYGLENSFC